MFMSKSHPQPALRNLSSENRTGDVHGYGGDEHGHDVEYEIAAGQTIIVWRGRVVGYYCKYVRGGLTEAIAVVPPRSVWRRWGGGDRWRRERLRRKSCALDFFVWGGFGVVVAHDD